MKKILFISFITISLFGNEKNINNFDLFNSNDLNSLNNKNIEKEQKSNKKNKDEVYNVIVKENVSNLSKKETYEIIKTFKKYLKKQNSKKDPSTILLEEAKNNNPIIQYELGKYFQNQNELNKAVFWYEKSSNNNYYYSNLRLATIYENENEKYFDPDKSIEYYEKSLNIAKNPKEIDFNIGLLYYKYKSNDVKNIYLGIYEFEKSIGFENKGESEYYLGLMYEKLFNYEETLKWLEKSANKNNTYAMVRLGDIFYNGENDIEKNYEISKKWYLKAMFNNDIYSMYQLSLLYYDGGFGLEKNRNLSNKLLLESKREGYYKSSYRYNDLYHKNNKFLIDENQYIDDIVDTDELENINQYISNILKREGR